MERAIEFVPAGRLSLDRLADLFTRSFEGYFYHMTALPDQLAQRVRVEQIDLWRSPVLLAGGEPAGVALVALRGERAWCGGFGIVSRQRGQSMARRLAETMLDEARNGGARYFTLEVLARNERALHIYKQTGMRIVRDLLVLEWRHTPGATLSEGPTLVNTAPANLLALFGLLHPAPPAWQRDLPALLSRGGMHGLALEEAGRPVAYALFQTAPGSGARIIDLGARDGASATTLLHGLKSRFARLTTVNEPEHSPITAALVAAGFTEIDRQHEMVAVL